MCGSFFNNNDRIEIDHIIPLVDKGPDKMFNLEAIHKECNQRKTTSENSERRRKTWPLGILEGQTK